MSSAGVLGLWAIFVNTRLGQAVDTLAMFGLQATSAPTQQLISVLHTAISYGGLGLILLLAVVTALLRRRPHLALRAVGAIVGANLTTQVLKTAVLPRPDLYVNWATPPSLPSGHTTAAASTAVAFIMVAPIITRAWMSLVGTVWVVFVGMTTLMSGWHRPSDVLAAVLVATAWGLLLAPNESGRVVGHGVRRKIAAAGWITLGTGATFLMLVAVLVARSAILQDFAGQIVFTSATGHPLWAVLSAVGATLAVIGVTAIAMREIDLVRSELRPPARPAAPPHAGHRGVGRSRYP